MIMPENRGMNVIDFPIYEALPPAENLIAELEQFRPRPYDDGHGTLTIGYGSTYLLDGSRVTLSTQCISEAEAREMMRDTVFSDGRALQKLIQVNVTANQIAALLSFIYNVGIPRFTSSTLLRNLNQSDYIGAADQMLEWIWAGGKKSAGLMTRRVRERQLFLRGDDA